METVLPWLFILSRVLFINPGDVFFDSKEYLMRWSNPSIWQALTTGHTPLHDGYVITFWPIYQFANIFTSIPAYVVMLSQVLLSLGTVILFYKTTTLLFSKKLALKSAVVFSLLPLFWVTNVTVMMETTYLFYWIASISFLVRYLKTDSRTIYLCLSSGFWLMAFLTHTVVLLWIPFVLYLGWMLNRKKFLRLMTAGLLTLVVASTINAYLLSASHGQSIGYGFVALFLSKFKEHASITTDWLSLLRFLRNWIVPTFYNNNGLVVLLSIAGFFGVMKKNRQLAALFALWILPTMITNQWWDSLFFGRHGLISTFAVAILSVFLTKKLSLILLVCYLGFGSLSALTLLNRDMPYRVVRKELTGLNPGGFLIESHFARPQINGEYAGEMFFVGEPGYDEKLLPMAINGYLSANKPVYVTGQALSEPYGLFNGPYLHSLTLSYKEPFLLRDILKGYTFSVQAAPDWQNNLVIFSLSKARGEYPAIKYLVDSRRRMDKNDPISRLTINLFTRR